MSKPIVFVVVVFFEPGFKAGGPVRSIANLVDWLQLEFDFYVYTRDRDVDDIEKYKDIDCNVWISRNGARVWYASPESFLRDVSSCINEVRPSLIYLNSFFAPCSRRVLFERRFVRDFTAPLLLAPRGEFQSGALQQRLLV